jgi:hypothetical protein
MQLLGVEKREQGAPKVIKVSLCSLFHLRNFASLARTGVEALEYFEVKGVYKTQNGRTRSRDNHLHHVHSSTQLTSMGNLILELNPQPYLFALVCD